MGLSRFPSAWHAVVSTFNACLINIRFTRRETTSLSLFNRNWLKHSSIELLYSSSWANCLCVSASLLLVGVLQGHEGRQTLLFERLVAYKFPPAAPIQSM